FFEHDPAVFDAAIASFRAADARSQLQWLRGLAFNGEQGDLERLLEAVSGQLRTLDWWLTREQPTGAQWPQVLQRAVAGPVRPAVEDLVGTSKAATALIDAAHVPSMPTDAKGLSAAAWVPNAFPDWSSYYGSIAEGSL